MFVELKTLKRGAIFHFPNKNIPYVFDGYNRFTKKYSYYKYYDISAFYEKQGTTLVDINHNF